MQGAFHVKVSFGLFSDRVYMEITKQMVYLFKY